MKKLLPVCIVLLISIMACNLPVTTPTPVPDLFQTMQASSPMPTIPVNSTLPAIAPTGEPTGKIAFTCQVFKEINREQICIVNADGTGYRRLTPEDSMRHFYPSISPDGGSVLYSALNEQSKHYEIYELVLATDEIKVLT